MKKSLTADFFQNTECVGFLGLGKSNLAVLSLLPKDKRVVIRSEKPICKGDIPRGIKPVRILSGKDAFDAPYEDILFLSPSVRRERPELSQILKSGVIPCSDFELFLSLNKKDIFAVTGSDGKSTTVTLAAALLSNEKSKVTPIGNVGVPFVKALSGSDKRPAVMELSSFTLRYAVPKSRRAAVTNITPNHLNWHKDFKEYKGTKLSLLKNAEEAVISADDAILFEYAKGKELFAVTSFEKSLEELKNSIKAEIFYTVENGYIKRNEKKLFHISILNRKEPHNIKNLLSALALTDGFVTTEWTKKVASEFSGLPHRLEEIAVHNGVKYINSSIDTSPARCEASLKSLDKNVIIILGGKSKGIRYESLREPLKNHAKLAVITGENRGEIYEDIRGSTDCAVIDGFDEAVLYSLSVAKSGDTVILSPASTSYDTFKSFEERGDKFKEIILKCTKNN